MRIILFFFFFCTLLLFTWFSNNLFRFCFDSIAAHSLTWNKQKKKRNRKWSRREWIKKNNTKLKVNKRTTKKKRLFSLMQIPFCAHATERNETRQKWVQKNCACFFFFFCAISIFPLRHKKNEKNFYCGNSCEPYLSYALLAWLQVASLKHSSILSAHTITPGTDTHTHKMDFSTFFYVHPWHAIYE